MAADLRTNLLYFGDNLGWLENQGAFPDASVDLVYLDPPFNSNRNYNVLFKESDVRESEAQIHAFEDTWAWDRNGRVAETYNTFQLRAPDKPRLMLKAMVDALGHNDVTAYLTMMAPRLLELHRVLKPTGSLYLHCDPTASHYLKMMLDSIFGPQRFLAEVVWKRTSAHSSANRPGPVHDVILQYSKSQLYTWNPLYQPYDAAYLATFFEMTDADGRRWKRMDLTGAGTRRGETGKPWRGIDVTAKGRHWAYPPSELDRMDGAGLVHWPAKEGGMPRYKQYADEMQGVPLQDIWTDLRPIHNLSEERLGYPTQKPLALLERIISASSNEGDVVLDPFCGCGTAVHAAQKLNRRWIGIDITPLATNLIRDRMEQAFPGLKVPIEGWPVDMAGAKALADLPDKYHFQDWAVIQSGGRPAGGERKKGADGGVDGVIPFLDGRTPKRGIISVKAGHTGPTHIRDLIGVVHNDPDAAFGVFICLNPPTKPMLEAALSAGSWVSSYDHETYPVIQILSAQDLIDGREVKMPASRTQVFAQASREKRGQQGRLV